MSLFVRLETGFWTHRKTLRLKSRIGNDALWLVPRLWCYAAEHQPDGNFSDYSGEELALLVGYPSNAQAMLQALQDCGFMDGMALHGWQERNGYHKVFADRATKAANARWEKKRKRDEKRGEEKRQALLQASPSISISESVDWMEKIRTESAYSHINLDDELGKARIWTETNHRKLTKRFFVNWLNRIEKPLNGSAIHNKPAGVYHVELGL